jgi:vitamin B12 transporter
MMFAQFLRKQRLLPVLLFALCFVFPLSPQETAQEQESGFADDSPLFTEEDGLTIIASPETTQQMETLTKEEIEKHNAPDIATLLQEALDLGLTRYGGYGTQTSINLRGFDSERIAFLIDGIPVNSVMSGGFDLSQIDPALVERIEVIYGGSDSKYNVSGSLGGVVNIITVKKQKTGLRLGGSISNTSAMPGKYRERSDESEGSPHWEDLLDAQNYSVFAGFGAKKYSWTANLFSNRAANHFLYTDETKRIRRNEANEVWDIGGSGSFVRDLPDAYSKFIVSGDMYYGDKNIPTGGFSNIAVRQNDFTTRQNIMLDMPRLGRDDLAMEASLSHAWHNLQYSDSLHDQHAITAINRWAWYPLSWLTLRSGWDYRFNYLDSTDNGFRNRHDGGFYVTPEFKVHEKFLIILSGKLVLSVPSEESVVIVPKLGFLWNPVESLAVKNNYFRSFKHPDFEDLYWNGDGMYGNPDLKPEDGWGADLGAEYRHKWLALESIAYAEWTEDSIHWTQSSGGAWEIENVGEAAFFGWDNKASIEIPVSLGPLQKIVPSVSYQYLLSYLLSYGWTWDSEKRIPYMPMHTLGGSLELAWETGSLAIAGRYESERDTGSRDRSTLPPYFLLNANVNQKLGERLAAFMALRNILNISYQSLQGYPMPGVTMTIGIRFNIEPKKGGANE